MFKLESFVTPLLANYLNKYIKDLKADDLQLSLWKGEAVLNKLDLRLDAIEHDLGLPFTFVSGNIQELRIKVPWTRLTAERVVIAVNTMECVVKLRTTGRAEDPMGKDRPRVEKKAPDGDASLAPPPPGYMESLSTRVLNNVHIQFTNLILRYVDDDFTLNILVKSANYFTVNDKWEKAFVEVAQPDLSLRRILVFHDLHVGLNDGRSSEGQPLVERAFLTCRFLTRFDSPDCRVVLSSVMNVLCDEVHISVMDAQVPMIRRLVDLAIAFQAGLLSVPAKPEEEETVMETENIFAGALNILTEDAVPTVVRNGGSSWASWALSFIPSSPNGDHVEEVDLEAGIIPSSPPPAVAKAITVALYGRKLSVSFSMAVPGGRNTGRSGRRSVLRLEAENAFLYNKSRQAKFSNFRAGVESCRLVAINECPCGRNNASESVLGQPILTFSNFENPASERSSFLSGSLFGSNDDEKEITDYYSPFDTFDSYIAYNTEAVLLRMVGAIVVDSVAVLEPPEDMLENLSTITPLELEYSNWKQNAVFRIIVSPPLLTIDSSALHRVTYFYRWFSNYRPVNYEQPPNLPSKSPLASSDEHRQLMTYIPMKSLTLVILKPVLVLIPPNHPPLPGGLRFAPRSGSKDGSASAEKESLSVLIQANRIEYHQASPIYINRILDVAVAAQGLLGDTLRHRCYVDCSAVLSSLELSLAIFTSRTIPSFRDIRTLILPTNLHYSAKRPIIKEICDRLWGPQDRMTLNCKSAELGASLTELLLSHLCIVGLIKDCGFFLTDNLFRIIKESTFNPASIPENMARIDVKCGQLSFGASEGANGYSQSGKIGSLEVSMIVGGTVELIIDNRLDETGHRGSMSPFLRDRASGLAEFGFGTVNQNGRMRISAYNVGFENGTSLSQTENIYLLRIPASMKFTIYPVFIRPFVDSLGVSIEYMHQLNYADILRSATLNTVASVIDPLPTRFELHHEKVSLDILDPDFEYLSASVHSGKFIVRSQHPNTSSMGYEARALMMYLGRSSRDPVLGPVSGSFEFQSFSAKDSIVSFFTADISLIPLRIGAITIPTALKVLSELQATQKILVDRFSPAPSADKAHDKIPHSLRFVVSQDDLRTQKWMYREIVHGDKCSDNDSVPDVQQIRFYETPTKQTMTWRYGELRTVSSVAIIPIPFQVSRHIQDSAHEIICSLQYFKRPLNKFIGLRSFTLMESKECVFQFPDLVPEDFDRLPISDVWRVEVALGIQGDKLLNLETGGFPMSVKSLAGCMKINSAIILGVPKAVHASLSVGVASVALIHHVPVLPRIPGHSLISGYTYDSSYPSDQEFARVKLDKISLYGRCVGEESTMKFNLESSFWIEIDFANYRFLTLQPLLESCCFSSSVLYTMEDKTYIQTKIESKTPLVMHCGQNALHTFSMAKVGWQMAQTGNYPSLPVINHLMICNDTCHVVRVRQYKTDECIYIKPKEMHPYSWRSQRIEQKLQFSVEPYPNLWSEPHNSEISCQLCSFPSTDDFDLGLVCNIRALNNIQKQVILGTQLVISNQLDHDVEIQLFVEPDYVVNPVVDSPQEIMLVPARSYSSTRCVPIAKIKRCRARFCGSAWCEYIQVATAQDAHIIPLPCSDGGTLDVWSAFVVPVAPAGSRWLVLSPLLRGQCHLPYPFKMEFEHESGARYEFSLTADAECYLPVRYSTADYQVRCRKENSPPQTFQLNLERILQQLPARMGTVDSAAKLEMNSLLAFEFGSEDKSKATIDNECVIATSSFLVTLRREMPYANTLQFNILPNGICVRNEYDDDLIICGVDDEVLVSIPRKEAAVLPAYKGQLRLGVQSSETIFLSDYFGVKSSQMARQTAKDCTNMAMLLCGGYMNVTFWEKRDGQYLIHHLTLTLKEENTVSLLTISSRYVAVRTSADMDDVLLSAFIVPKVHMKLNYMDELKSVPSDKLTSQIIPLSPFVYVVPANHPVHTDPHRVPDLAMYVCVAAETAQELRWSYPREIRDVKNHKSTISTIVAPGPTSAAGLCFKTSIMEEQGICYIAFERMDLPNLILWNNCTYPLTIGECAKKSAGIVTFEETEMFLPLPSVEPGGVASYALPSRDGLFPTVSTTGIIYRFRVGRMVRTGAQNNVTVWSSTSVDPFSSSNDSFISIPGICYLKLHFERQSRHTVRITIDPLSRVGTPILLPGNASPALPLSDVPPSPTFPYNGNIPNTPSIPLNIGVSCILKSVVVTIDDEISKTDVVAEVLRLSLDDVSIQFYCDGDTTKTYECAVNISDLQLDNQLYDSGFFDFPVILAKETPKRNVQSAVNLLCKLNPTTFRPENLHISLAPMACFVEDCLAFHLLRLVDTFLAPALLVAETKSRSVMPRIPTSVVMERIHIAPLDVYLSIHAALKVFVALDKTPLSFAEIECFDVNSTVEEVWRFVTGHYFKETLLSAGWVIGSMDILGNPANLLRSLTSGCNDLFVRPFSSLHAGPVSFLQGVAVGASAFLTSISAGTISSVTNLAESVSRNLDQISLDQEHILRQMEVKYRQRPEGLASGLQQGLTGFGMGLLGAVAGLVDQPMQAMMRPKMTSAQFVTALMLGVTKGVVGAVSKPIAGAAGFVSKTGQGILRGQGLLNFPPRRWVTPPKYATGFVESTLKYIWKVAPLLPNTVHTLCVVEALPVTKTWDKEPDEPMCLFLTDSALFVISSADDEFRQAYALSKLHIRIGQPTDALSRSNRDLMQVTLLIESSETGEVEENEMGNGDVEHFVKESYLLEWKDAKLFEELFLVAKSGL